MNEFPMVLGAAQLGMPYGIANRRGQPTEAESDAILKAAWESGTRTIDTAASYGESEARIGHFLRHHPECPFEVVTKLAGPTDSRSPVSVRHSVETSEKRLGRPPHAVLLHKPKELEVWYEGLGETLEALRAEGRCEKLGVSVYEPEELELALRISAMEYIQIPYNVFDHRWTSSGLIERAVEAGRTIMIRSVFLQGLLLMSPEDANTKLPESAPWLERWFAIVEKTGRAADDLAIAFTRTMIPEGRLVLGAEAVEQVRANAALIGARLNKSELSMFAGLGEAPRIVFDPRVWPK